MDCSVELERSCTLLSDSLKKFHEHLHLDLKPKQSDEEPNILHEVCKKSKDMVQKDLVILGAQSLSFNYWSQRIVESLLPNDSTLKYSICPLDKMWQNVESIELIAHSFAYVIILNKELLFWLSSHPNVTIGRIIRSPNKTIGLFIGDGKYLNKCHREQLIHFHRWNRVIDANLDCPNTTDRLIKITLERVLSYSNMSGSSFKVISPDEFVSWKRNRLLILIQGLELDINSRVELEIDKGASSVQTFSRYSGQVLEFNMPPICHPTSIELIVDGNSLVAHGREVGIYASWSECHALVDGFDGARYNIFHNRVEAQNFLKEEAAKEPLTGENSNIFSSNQTPSINYEIGSAKTAPYYAIARGHKVGVFDSCREEAEKFVKEEAVKDTWTGRKSNKFRSKHIKSERGFSVDNTDWTYAEDKGYYMNEDGWGLKLLQMELCRNSSYISQAIKRVKDDGLRKIVIYSDSKFAINSVEDWIPKWKKNGWKKSCGGHVKNKNDFCELEDIKEGMTVKFIHVRGHKGIKGNECADKLARKGAK
ncbi:rnhA [Lepeophtheirus salmonis]|nr:rnhA [Lepeophtheirus salmonis]CAF2885447.1 rnhA [Lepeophtheirus salmonis]